MFYGTEVFLLALAFLWLVGLTIFFAQFYVHYRRLSRNIKHQSLLKILDELFSSNEDNKKAIQSLEKYLRKIENQSNFHIQKIGLTRFNPFKDTGGDQSFILSILDANNTGVIISSMHTRGGTRWYAKKVVKGRGVEYNLSKDEEKSIIGATTLDLN